MYVMKLGNILFINPFVIISCFQNLSFDIQTPSYILNLNLRNVRIKMKTYSLSYFVKTFPKQFTNEDVFKQALLRYVGIP